MKLEIRNLVPPPDRILIQRAADIVRKGGVVAFPTETSYGLGASIEHIDALERIYIIKKRPRHKPLLILISNISDLIHLVSRVPPAAVTLMERFWPGPLTLLLPAKPGLPWPLCADTAKVGVRISSHSWAHSMVTTLGNPMTATSANLSEHPATCRAEEVADQLRFFPPDYILDGGLTSGGAPSTIIDVCTDPPEIIREGAINSKDISNRYRVQWSGDSGHKR
ncbi:MAG TPA: threonylcarbamoyl-AMP synthase [Deltaproteobacteria bacterium]|nr:threonylcarbamoyl-AMP synthase [Deltaproteobacteria bacterium]HDH98082.1 threonylcarbamoyl-AMP synthase [Deltaproteobacteria bacterium]